MYEILENYTANFFHHYKYILPKGFLKSEPVGQIAERSTLSAASSLLTTEMLLNEFEYLVRTLPTLPTGQNYLSCAAITKQQTATGPTFEIRFLNTCSDQTARSGKLTVSYETATGKTILTPSNYIVDNMSIVGSYTFEAITEQQKELLKCTIVDGKLTYSTGEYIKFSIDRKNSFKEGNTTANQADDVFETISATYSIEIKDQSVLTQITASNFSPYIVKYQCNNKFRPRSGKIKFKPTTGTDNYLLFGIGNCSDQASISKTP